MNRTYSELIKIPTFKERLEYLRLNGNVGDSTFGHDRYLNQRFYRSELWRSIRNRVIVRDNGCDLGVEGYIIDDIRNNKNILVHHINPITIDDIINGSDKLTSLENLITVSFDTHNDIHYGIVQPDILLPETRSPNDMCPWK